MICLINDVENGYALRADNCTLADAAGEVTVKDVASGKTLYSGKFTAEANNATGIAELAKIKGQGMLLISYSIDGKKFANHYLYGEPPYKLSDYRNWIKRTKIYE